MVAVFGRGLADQPSWALGTAPADGKTRQKPGSGCSRRVEPGVNNGYCLECAAIFRHLPLTIQWRLLAIQGLGLYKSNDDQSHSDDLCRGFCCLGGRGCGDLAGFGAGLSAPGYGLFALSAIPLSDGLP